MIAEGHQDSSQDPDVADLARVLGVDMIIAIVSRGRRSRRLTVVRSWIEGTDSPDLESMPRLTKLAAMITALRGRGWSDQEIAHWFNRPHSSNGEYVAPMELLCGDRADGSRRFRELVAGAQRP